MKHGKVGHGKTVHLISDVTYSNGARFVGAVCGTGQTPNGFRTRGNMKGSAVQFTDAPVTCQKCLARMNEK